VHPDDEDDDGDFGSPPPLENRRWRHPSELAGNSASGAGARPTGVQPLGAPVPLPPAPRTRTWLVALLSGGMGAVLTLAVVVGLGGFRRLPAPPAGVERVQTDLEKDPDAPIAIAEKVTPAVARLDVAGPSGISSGTAVVFRSSGYLLTTADLVDGAEHLSITLDGSTYPAQFVGADPESDVAVVKVDAPSLSTVVLGRPASKLQLGEPVIAVEPIAPATGGGGVNVPVGVINDLNERLESDDTTRKTLYGMVQTNLRASALASGAPLIDASGAMIGLITSRGSQTQPAATGPDAAVGTTGATVGRTAVGEPIARFAIPIDYAKSVADSLISDGKVSRAWLGVSGQPLTPDEAARAGTAGGLKVNNVDPGSPAADAKLQVDDIVVRIDDKPISSIDDLVVNLRQHRPGDYVAVWYIRRGEPQPAFTTLRDRNSP
jgi:putative serine protease PepD